MYQNKNNPSKTKKKFTKKNVISAVLLIVLFLAAVGAAFGIASTRVDAATNRAGVYMLYGKYDIGDGSTSGYMDQFGIQISTQYFYDDSGTNGTTKYNYATYNWTYFNFYIHAEDVKEHVSFKLTRNGSTYTNKTLSGNAAGYLYQGALTDGDYVLTYVGTYKQNIFVTKTYTFTYNFTVDTTAPYTSLKAGGSTISSGSYTNKAIAFSATDNYSTSRIYYLSPSASSYSSTTASSKSVSATSANNGWWYFYASDGYQSTSTYKVYLDTVAPVGKITNSSGTTLSSGSYTNKPVKYTATDTGGVSYLQVQTPGSSTWATYSSGTALSSATGWYYFRAVDKAGNISSTSSVYYDATAPSGTLYGGTTIKSTGGYTNASYVKYVASDSHSGISACYVKKPGSSSYVAYTSGSQLTAEGTYYFYCKDRSGNISSTVSITLDKTVPTGALYGGTTSKTTGSYTNAAYVKYVASDALSGVSACYVKMPGSSSYTAYTSGTQLATQGTYYFYCKDRANNTSATVSITLDTTKPTGTLYGGTGTVSSGGYSNAAYIKFVPSDNIGLGTTYVLKPGASAYATYTSGTQLTAEGKYSFYTVDLSGNRSETYTITLDRTAPVGTLYGGTTAKSSGSYTNAAYVKYTATDSLSSIKAYYVKMPGSSTFTAYSSGTQLATQGTYSFYAVDNSNNQSTVVTITLDTTKPTGTLYGGASTITSGGSTNAAFIKFLPSDNIGVGNSYVKLPGATGFTAYTAGTQYTNEGVYQFYTVDKASNQSVTYTITLDRQIPEAQLFVDGKEIDNGSYTNGEYISFECEETCYVKMPGSTEFVSYVSGTEFDKVGKYVFKGISEAGNSSGEYVVIIDRTIKKVNVSNVTDGKTNGDVVISWTNGDANSFAPIKSVTVNGKAVSNGATVYTINTGSYIVKVVDAGGNEWETEFTSAKKNILTDTLQKEYYEAPDAEGEMFAFTSYENALKFAIAREKATVKTGTWSGGNWDVGIPMDAADSANAAAGTYYIYKKSGSPNELVAYFTEDRLNAVIEEYAKVGIVDYFYWEKAPATAGEGQNLYAYSSTGNILASSVEIGENVGVLLDGEAFVASVVEAEGKHVLTITDNYGNSCEYNLTIIRTLPDIHYAIGEGDKNLADLERTYYFKDSITISITDALDEMAMFNIYGEDGKLIRSLRLGETFTVSDSGIYTVVAVNHKGESEEFKFQISRNAPSATLVPNAESKQLVITVISSTDDESHIQTLAIYKSTDDGNTWELLEADDYGSAIAVGTDVYKFRTSGMYKVVITDEFRTGIDAVTSQVTYAQPASVGILEGVTTGGHTNGEVTFSWSDEAIVTVTKDGETVEYESGDKLTKDGSYTVTIEDYDGNKSEFTFIIDTVEPTVVLEGAKADVPVNKDVSVTIEDEDATAVLIKDGIEVGPYVSGTPVTESGKYTVVVTDLADNESSVSFVIDKAVDFEINVNDGGLANSVTIKGNESLVIVLTKNGEAIEYNAGDAITDPADYTVKLTDDLGNTREMSFIVVPTVATNFSHNFDKVEGFEKVLVNEEEFRLNYGTLDLNKDGAYKVDVVVSGKTYSFAVTIDTKVDHVINVHDKGYANSVKLAANEQVTLTATKNGEAFEYELGTDITEPGAYTVKMVDALGNTKEISFTVVNAVYAKFEQEIDEMPGFEKVLVNGEEVTLEKGTLMLTATGAHEVTIVANGIEQKFTVNVDATAPTLTITGVENGGITKDAVILSDPSEEATVVLTFNDEVVEYKLGDEITEPGVYKVTVTDAMGNATEYTFEIEKGVNGAIVALIVIGVIAAIGGVVFFILKKKKVF